MRSLRIYSREFQQLYPSSLLHVLFRDGERALWSNSSAIDYNCIATLFFIVSVKNLHDVSQLLTARIG